MTSGRLFLPESYCNDEVKRSHMNSCNITLSVKRTHRIRAHVSTDLENKYSYPNYSTDYIYLGQVTYSICV